VNAGRPTTRSLALALATRGAVSRMLARGRNRCAVRAGWSRLVLRWRRRGSRPPRLAVSRTTIAMQTWWFPAFHLHLAGSPVHPRSRAAAFAAAPAAVAAVQRSHLRRKSDALVRARALAPGASPGVSRVAGILRTSPTQVAQGRASTTFEPRHRCRTPTQMDISLSRARGASRPSTQREGPSMRRAARSEETTLPLLVRPRWRRPERAQLKSRPADTSSPGAAVRLRRGDPHRVDMTWRSSPVGSTAAAGHGTDPVVRVSPRPPAAVARPTVTAPPAESRTDRQVVLPAASVDARLLDRLTDDVIRRVERRIRIERERRGL